MLITRVFVFSHNFFPHYISFLNDSILDWSKCIEVADDYSCKLIHSHTMTPLTPLGNKPFENTVGKGEIARNEQFLLFPQWFLSICITCCHFRQI